MPEFFTFAAGAIGKLGVSLASRSLGETIKDTRTKRRMERMIEDAVDRIVEQIDDFLTGEHVTENRKAVLVSSLAANLQPLADDPQKFFEGNLDGALIFNQRHPNGNLPQEILEEDLGHFYTVLFPQIAHFLAGSRVALAQWQAEGYREEFKRLTQIAEEIRAMNIKVAELPVTINRVIGTRIDQEADTAMREFSQTLLNNLLLRLDLSPLRAERALHGSLRDHFIVPAFQERRENAKTIGQEAAITKVLAAPGARRILHGGPGVGKTTYSLWLQSKLLESESGRVAVVFRLREIEDIERHSLLDLLRDCAGTHLRDVLTHEILRRWHENGRLVLILDGFDEVPEERRDSVEQWIKNLAAISQQTAIVVTSRPLQSGHLENLKAPWQQWDLLPFDQPRIVKFIECWHRYLPDGELSASERKVNATALADTFLADPSLKPLADTPLMLGTLLFVHHRDKKLPSGRVDLYERYIAAMLGLRDSGMGVQARATKLTDREKRTVLGQIALHFHLNQIDAVNDAVMRKLVEDALEKFNFEEDVERLLPALRERTGLLQGPGAWSFTHKTIGEFLMAELVCEGSTRLPDRRRLDRRELWTHRHKDNWTSILFFWAGKTSPRELEEFVCDLLHETNDQAALLALALLNDQGDRLTHETQRTLARELIKKSFPADSGLPSGRVHCATSVAPRFVSNNEYSALLIPLRGLSNVDSHSAFFNLFARRVFVPADVKNAGGEIQKQLTVVSVHALTPESTIKTEDLLASLSHLPRRELALYCFRRLLFVSFIEERRTLETHRDTLTRWITAFPEGKLWVPLLLAGMLSEAEKYEQQFVAVIEQLGLLLWEWRNEAVDEQWLERSDDCMGWYNRRGIDILQATHRCLDKYDSVKWGISPVQHAELKVWCQDLLNRRALLKARESE